MNRDYEEDATKNYCRVAPRDLFNESKLLKCLGQLALCVHDGVAPTGLIFKDSGSPYRIEQRQSDGGLCVVRGIRFELKGKGGRRRLRLYSIYNSQKPYPLRCELAADGDSVDVFDEFGELTDDFIRLMQDNS